MKDFLEGFAGEAMITLHLLASGFSGWRLDKTYKLDHDVSMPSGFRLWMDATSLLVASALDWHAPQCSSFSILCHKQHQRKAANNFMGDTTASFVRQGNDLMARSALGLLIAYLCDCIPVLDFSDLRCMARPCDYTPVTTPL